ncbi:MAG: sulfurtransferase-like selenium metabolism protein YedF [Dehalococcoidia bacterium]|nr:MAG: sulfurtransferase-like selenium metabolism protein YedF [Dehalococcoidia bacterium]
MVKEVDCRKLTCPLPVVNTKKALEQAHGENLLVVVDNIVSRDNVRRFVQSQGHEVKIEDRGGGLFYMHITPNPEAGKKPAGAANIPTSGGVVVFITTDQLGVGDERLGQILMKAFLNTLHDSEPKPEKIMFINNGVKLTTEGSEVLDSLAALTADGVQIMSCGTCLNYYGILDKLKFGIVGNMYDIVNSLLEAGKVIKI